MRKYHFGFGMTFSENDATVNGVSGYTFSVTMTDNGEPGSGSRHIQDKAFAIQSISPSLPNW